MELFQWIHLWNIHVRVYDIYERHYSARNKAMSHPFKTTSAFPTLQAIL